MSIAVKYSNSNRLVSSQGLRSMGQKYAHTQSTQSYLIAERNPIRLPYLTLSWVRRITWRPSRCCVALRVYVLRDLDGVKSYPQQRQVTSVKGHDSALDKSTVPFTLRQCLTTVSFRNQVIHAEGHCPCSGTQVTAINRHDTGSATQYLASLHNFNQYLGVHNCQEARCGTSKNT